MQNQPKTVQDYKDVVKILKLKIIKQNKRIEELELKNKTYEEQINSVTIRGQDFNFSSKAVIELENQANFKKQQREVELNTLKGKVAVMGEYVKGLKKMGITPESVFRISDFAYKNFVQSDYFREVLSKMRLGLTQKQISCLIFIFDESYSGFITRQDYYNTLNAYKLGGEETYHQYIHQCIFKLSQMMHNDKVNLIKFYEEMEGRSKSKVGNSTKKMIDLNVFEEQLKKNYGSKVAEKQIVGAFNAIDLQSQGYLEKSNFLYTITSCINKLLMGEEMHTKKTGNEWSQAKSQMSEPVHSSNTSPKKFDKVTQNNANYTSKVSHSNDNPVHSNDGCIPRLQKEFSVSLTRVYEQIMLYDFSHRLTMKTFKKLCSKINENIPSEFLSEVFKEIDIQFKGSLYLNDLINYYLANSADNEMIFRLFGKYLEVSDLDSDKFWFMFGLNEKSEISKQKFLQIMKKNFESKEEKLWQNFWGIFDKGRGSCNVGAIIKSFQKYES